ncbi:MAG: hypothetical protein IKD09_02865, partial [Lentisphaeria bacterium]|nr:hypothetical protein [Lentisphaeria bacterium]
YEGLAIGDVPSPGRVLNAIPIPVIKSDIIDQNNFFNVIFFIIVINKKRRKPFDFRLNFMKNNT